MCKKRLLTVKTRIRSTRKTRQRYKFQEVVSLVQCRNIIWQSWIGLPRLVSSRHRSTSSQRGSSSKSQKRSYRFNRSPPHQLLLLEACRSFTIICRTISLFLYLPVVKPSCPTQKWFYFGTEGQLSIAKSRFFTFVTRWNNVATQNHKRVS